MCITAGIFTVYAYALSTAGPAFVWTRPVVAAGQILVALVLAELAGRLPLSGYAFQWTSRLASSRYGWFVGWAGLMAFIPGFTGTNLGLAPIAACHARGVRVLGVGGRRAERLRLACAFGAEAAVDDPGDLADLTGGEGPDVVVEAVGQPQAWSQAVAVVRRGGTVVLFGGLPREDVPLDPYRIHYHELTLRGSYHHTPAAIRQALALLAGGAYPFAELLTHTYPLERVAEPLAQAAGLTDPDDRLLKASIRP
jgi:amino acid transporter